MTIRVTGSHKDLQGALIILKVLRSHLERKFAAKGKLLEKETTNFRVGDITCGYLACKPLDLW